MTRLRRASAGRPAGRARARLREAAIGLGLMAAALLAAGAALEAALRFLPVATGIRAQPVNAGNPVFRFEPDRSFVFSRDWDMALANRGRTNNAGFVNDQNYARTDEKPLLAVIGDSYIEAAMVPFAETAHGRLAAVLAGRLRVYSFAAAGAPLSQYLIWARHAVAEWGAGALVVNIVGNDFDESLWAYSRTPGFWRYDSRSDGALALTLVEFEPSRRGHAVYASALARYLIFNLRAQEHARWLGAVARGWLGMAPANAQAPAQAPGPFAGNTDAAPLPERLDLSRRAVAAFFDDLLRMTGLPVERIAFSVDGFRYEDGALAASASYFGLMRRYFIAEARRRGFEAIDLDPAFFARHRQTGARFEYPNDGHWNSAGHEVAADAILASLLVARLLAP